MTKWAKTGVQNLLRNELSGRYYARFKVAGKHKWYALETDKKTVAVIRLADLRKDHIRMQAAQRNSAAGTATLPELAAILRGQIERDPSLKPSTKEFHLQQFSTFPRTWPNWTNATPQSVTADQVLQWRDKLLQEGGGHVNAFAHTKRTKPMAPKTVNNHIDTLRRILDLAVEHGQIAVNPVARPRRSGNRIKLTVVPKKPVLPETALLLRAFNDIAGFSIQGPSIADFLRALTFSGMRRGEAKGVRWCDIHWEAGTMDINGTKTAASKRTIPLFSQLRTVLSQVYSRHLRNAFYGVEAPPQPTDLVFTINYARNSLTRVAAKYGFARLTHHDLRDVFTTQCIESGVDIPTVAKWLGHTDGGALLMKTYAHLRQEHSLAQAKKVSFGSNNGGA